MALERIEGAAADGTLLGYPDPVSLLLRWRDLLGQGGGDRVRSWLATRLEDAVVINLAPSFVSTGWTHTMGDGVSRRHRRLERGALQALVDPDQFRDRVALLRVRTDLAPERKADLDAFEAAWLKNGDGDFED